MIRGETYFKKSKTEQREGVKLYRLIHCGSPGKESTCNVGDLGSIPGLEDPLEKGMATYSSTLGWKIPWTVSSMGLQRVGHD